MEKFDFIRGDAFKVCLENDYQEMLSANKAKAWKAVQVLAGSIIEAILTDYLLQSGYQQRTSKNPLTMRLADIITACRQENILSEKTEHLSHVIRQYRNLIHPGRLVREKEVVTEHDAAVAIALTEIIIEEITVVIKQNYGYTAEQIINKLENDPTSRAIMSHLLKEVHETEKRRLLINLIPKKYLEHQKNIELNELYDPEGTTGRISKTWFKVLSSCFFSTFDLTSNETRQSVAKHIVKTIKEDASDIAWRYDLFKGDFLTYLNDEEASLIKDHLFAILKTPIDLPNAVNGIFPFLADREAKELIAILVESSFNHNSWRDRSRTSIIAWSDTVNMLFDIYNLASDMTKEYILEKMGKTYWWIFEKDAGRLRIEDFCERYLKIDFKKSILDKEEEYAPPF